LLGTLLGTLPSLASELFGDWPRACAPISRRKIGAGFRTRQSTRTFCPPTVYIRRLSEAESAPAINITYCRRNH